MSTLSLEITPSTAETLNHLSQEQRRAIELELTAQLSRLIAPIMTREEAVREIGQIAEKAENRARSDGMTLEDLNRLIDDSK